MRPSKITLFATGAVVAAGLIGLASARISPVHVLTVALPDGSVERVAYVGEAPPRVAVEMAARPFAPAFAPVAVTPLDLDPAFADLERISAAMDREAAAMMLAAPGEGGLQATSALSASGVCGRSVEYHYAGDGKAPTVLTRSWGACARAPSPPAPTASPRSAPVAGAPLIQASYSHGGKAGLASRSL